MAEAGRGAWEWWFNFCIKTECGLCARSCSGSGSSSREAVKCRAVVQLSLAGALRRPLSHRHNVCVPGPRKLWRPLICRAGHETGATCFHCCPFVRWSRHHRCRRRRATDFREHMAALGAMLPAFQATPMAAVTAPRPLPPVCSQRWNLSSLDLGSLAVTHTRVQRLTRPVNSLRLSSRLWRPLVAIAKSQGRGGRCTPLQAASNRFDRWWDGRQCAAAGKGGAGLQPAVHGLLFRGNALVALVEDPDQLLVSCTTSPRVCKTHRRYFRGPWVPEARPPRRCLALTRAEGLFARSNRDPASALGMRGMRGGAAAVAAALAAALVAVLPLLLLAALAAVAPAAAQAAPWQVITDLQAAKVAGGVEVSIVGPPQQPFSRPPPRTLDPHLLTDFAGQLNLLQDVSGEGDNTFTDTSVQVGSVRGGCGCYGMVWLLGLALSGTCMVHSVHTDPHMSTSCCCLPPCCTPPVSLPCSMWAPCTAGLWRVRAAWCTTQAGVSTTCPTSSSLAPARRSRCHSAACKRWAGREVAKVRECAWLHVRTLWHRMPDVCQMPPRALHCRRRRRGASVTPRWPLWCSATATCTTTFWKRHCPGRLGWAGWVGGWEGQ